MNWLWFETHFGAVVGSEALKRDECHLRAWAHSLFYFIFEADLCVTALITLELALVHQVGLP